MQLKVPLKYAERLVLKIEKFAFSIIVSILQLSFLTKFHSVRLLKSPSMKNDLDNYSMRFDFIDLKRKL